MIRPVRVLIALLMAFCISAPALAEQLSFDHRTYPPLQQVLDGGNRDMVLFNDKDPSYLVDLIVVRGKSTRNWTEAMVIIARSPDAKAGVTSAQGWVEELKRQALAQCPSDFAILAEDDISITLERTSHDCPANYPARAIYRVVQGKSSLFLLGAMSKDGFSDEARRGWLALMASAHLS